MNNPALFLTPQEEEIASNEGWGVFDVDGNETEFQIQKSDDAAIFETDQEAWSFVISKAFNGSALHQKAVAFIKANSPAEFKKFVHDVDVVETASLDDEHSGNFNQPYLLVFSNGEAVGCGSEEIACKKQLDYRKALSLL